MYVWMCTHMCAYGCRSQRSKRSMLSDFLSCSAPSFWNDFIIIIINYCCVFLYVIYEGTYTHVWELEDSHVESVLTFHLYVGSRDSFQVVGLAEWSAFTCRAILLSLGLYFWDEAFSLNLELSNSARSTHPRNLVSALPHARIAEAYFHTWLFTWVLGTWTQVTVFMEQTLGSTGPPHSPYFSLSPNTVQPHSTEDTWIARLMCLVWNSE